MPPRGCTGGYGCLGRPPVRLYARVTRVCARLSAAAAALRPPEAALASPGPSGVVEKHPSAPCTRCRRRPPLCRHRGAVSAAADLAAGMRPWEARGCDAPWVSFCLKMVRVVLAAGATPVVRWGAGAAGQPLFPVLDACHACDRLSGSQRCPPPSYLQLVFDGRRLPAKEATNAARRARREEAKARALQLQNDVSR